mmetsp:Transcript_14672/g.31294  ORF Transcript_14672/g.31294 Transcript_14672/m.31294 type:complete len:135 (-) Transcript_14672:129-533(-)
MRTFHEIVKEPSTIAEELQHQMNYVINIVEKGNFPEPGQGDPQATLDNFEDKDNVAPESDVDEHPSLRESTAPTGERQGEHLLVFAYLCRGDEEKQKSPDGKRSPIMKLLQAVPEEMMSKPRLVSTPPVSEKKN